MTEPVCTKRKKMREKNQPFLEITLGILILLIIRGAAFVCRGKCRGEKENMERRSNRNEEITKWK